MQEETSGLEAAARAREIELDLVEKAYAQIDQDMQDLNIQILLEHSKLDAERSTP